MNFALNAEQEELRSVVERLLDTRAPLASVRDVAASEEGFDRALWDEMAGELGLLGLCVPERFGGGGYSFVEQAVVMIELGRRLVPGPYLSSAILAVQTLLEAGDDDLSAELIPDLVGGRRVATMAVIEDERRWGLQPCRTTAAHTDGAVVIDGEKVTVTDAGRADLFLVTAVVDARTHLYIVPASAPGVTVDQHDSMDPTRPVGRVRFSRTPAREVRSQRSALEVLGSAFEVGAIALACEQAGAAAAALAMATEYAGERRQFGRQIGSFQSIKHMLADVLVDNESAWSAAMYGAWAVDHARSELGHVSPLALAFASDALLSAAETNVQVHGGIGFTWEHDAQFFVRRALASRQILGAPDQHRERLAAHLLADTTPEVTR